MKADEWLDFALAMYRTERPGASDGVIYQLMVQEHGPSSGLAALMAQRIGAEMETSPAAVMQARGEDDFLRSFEWRRVRMEVLQARGAKCECCGRTAKDGVRINVDHIKPRKRYPQLALDPKNLQVLCEDCNHGKGNKFETDWRGAA